MDISAATPAVDAGTTAFLRELIQEGHTDVVTEGDPGEWTA